MIRISEAKARLVERVPELIGRIGTAAQFSALVESNAVPQVTPYAFVLLGGLQGGQADVVSGLFRQAVREKLLVILFVRNAADATGAGSVDELTPLVRKIIMGLAGWGPEDCPAEMQAQLLKTVKRNGDRSYWDGEVGSVYCTAAHATILAMPYHYIPLYQR